MDIQYLSPAELIPYGKNAKRHSAEQVKLIANSIKQFGFQQPIVVDKDNGVDNLIPLCRRHHKMIEETWLHFINLMDDKKNCKKIYQCQP